MLPQEIKDLLKDAFKSKIFRFIIVLMFFILCAISFLFHIPILKDNLIEQLTEEIIKTETGIDVDFSPENGEK